MYGGYLSRAMPNHCKIISQYPSEDLQFRKKLSEDVMTIKFDSKRCDIFTKTQKLGGSTAVFRSFPFKTKIGDILETTATENTINEIKQEIGRSFLQ